jgi:outer membrane protein assembly factor BamB
MTSVNRRRVYANPPAVCRILLIFLLYSPAAAARAGENWPQFRGPAGDGHSDAVELPLTWSETENVAWKTAIEGRGWSSPVVWGDQIWLTTALETAASADEAKEALRQLGMPVPSPHVARSLTLKAVCVDRTSGRLQHEVTLFRVKKPTIICSVNSFASPTPVVERGRVYCDFGALGTACLDTATGKILWSRHLVIEHQVGPGSSPLLYGDLLVLVRDGCDEQYLTALDKKTGATVWRTDRPPMSTRVPFYRKAFSTPLLVATGESHLMIVPAAQWMAAYDPADGRELWRVDTGSTFSNAVRPVYGHGLAYVGTSYGGSQLLAIRIDGRGDVTQSHVAWNLKKQVPKRASPLLVGDELYCVSDSGIATCLDARTGEIHWSERLSGPHSASPVYTEGRIYCCGEDGTTTVLRPGKEFHKLAENVVKGRIMASPAMLDGTIVLRTAEHLYRIGLSPTPADR